MQPVVEVSGTSSDAARAKPLSIQPMTTADADGTGYFSDPYPIRRSGPAGAWVQLFSGTTRAILSCAYPVVPRCFRSTPDLLDAGAVYQQIGLAGATITNLQNLNVFQDDEGGWHAVLAIGVKTRAHPDSWTVLVHAHPAIATGPAGVPLQWSADTVLSGSFSIPVEGNYDGKYFEDSGKLYLLYVRNLAPKPALRNGIVLQRMLSPTRQAPEDPVLLLMPGDRYGPLASEDYGSTPAKLVEAPFLFRIGGHYALLYATGAYQENDYKAGVAWSDTLMPTDGGLYRKVLQDDPRGLWGQTGTPEVRYLLQSQQPEWPNFTGGFASTMGTRVIGPGVASAVAAPDGLWQLYFAGFDPNDLPLQTLGVPGVFEASHRRPYLVPLRTAVPPDQPVATASDADLATWLQPARR